MALILGIESSGNEFSVAILRDTELLFSTEILEERSQERRLAPVILEAFEQIGLSINDLDACGIGSGPGSYTGLRIGMSTASGLCFARGIPLIPVGTLDNLSFQLLRDFPDASYAFPVMLARKEEFFLGLWEREMESPLIPPACYTLNQLPDILSTLPNEKTLVSVCRDENLHAVLAQKENVIFAAVKPGAAEVAEIALHKWLAGREGGSFPEEPDYLKPVYISSKK